MRFADLHLHTIFSDGTYTPEEVIREASKEGLSAIAVVDHDAIGAITPTINAGKELDIEVLPGIELTTDQNGTEVHILGYLLDYQNPALKEKLEMLNKARVERVYKITEKLKNLGLNLSPDAVFKLALKGSPGRLHIARAMVEEKLVGSIYEAFKKYIGDKGPAYVCGFKLTPREGIKLIRDFSGIPVLAHPYTMNNDELIPEFIKLGLMGLEVYYTEHSQGMINFYLSLAKEYNLLVTGGSDCHGKAKPEVKIGLIKIPYELVENLKEAKEKL